MPLQKLETANRGEKWSWLGRTSAPGEAGTAVRHSRARPAHLSPQAARQQVVERQPLGTDLRDGGGRSHPGTRNIKFSL